MHIFDTISGTHFLVDTGAEVSIVPPTTAEVKEPQNRNLIAANGSPIKSFGTCQMQLLFGKQKYQWLFHVADVHKSILGADFLRSNNLLVDLTNRRLIRLDTFEILRGTLSNQTSLHISVLVSADRFRTLLHW